MGRRIPRLNEQLKREITAILKSDVRDPRIGFVTITHVEVTQDISHAKVFASVMGEDEDKEASVAGLHAAAPFIRGELGRRLRVRRVPELHFELDRALEHAMHIERLLSELRVEDEGLAAQGEGEHEGEGLEGEGEGEGSGEGEGRGR